MLEFLNKSKSWVFFKYKTLIFSALLVLSFPIEAYSKLRLDSIYYQVETRATFAGGENTPFWMVSNLHGMGSPEFNNGYVRGKVVKPIAPDKRFSWGAGVDLAAGWSLPGAFRAQQLYAELKYRALWVSLGSREWQSKYNNQHLSTGDLLFSGNSLPVPQLRVGTYGFAPFWGTKGWLSFDIYLAYGMFTDSRWQKSWVIPGRNRTSNVLLCSRGFSFRVGNPKVYPLTLDVGIEMGTQFGGTIYSEYYNGYKMPTKLIDWLKAIIPLKGGDDTPVGDQTNVQGNMNGEYSIGLHWSPAADWEIKAYWEHYFEDHSQMTFEYGLWKDGLYGLEVTFPKNRFLGKFVYEYVCTTDQTGAVNNNYTPEVPEQVSGRDNYYNHYIYNCWQTWGMSMGTPLAISPLYNREHILKIFNTRFIANHFALEGTPFSEIKWRFLLTFTQNWGSYWHPLPKKMNNCSGLIELDYHPARFKGWFAKGALAWDRGPLLGNNFGGMVTIGYQGSVRF